MTDEQVTEAWRLLGRFRELGYTVTVERPCRQTGVTYDAAGRGHKEHEPGPRTRIILERAA